ncbi:MAG: signal recognition particle-docking protein FtsY [Atribacterota bacterium]|nr:signal recognition particle-docking protein FtsY [Atribacterota bacterium]
MIDKFDMIFSDASGNKDEVLEKIEELLILSDIGPRITNDILKEFNKMNLHNYKINNFENFKNKLKDILIMMIPEQEDTWELEKDRLNIIMAVGVNGTGKTSFIGKLANYFKNTGERVLLIPADTYRAGAIKQLILMANRINVEYLNTTENADPASVVFDGIKSAIAKNKNIVLVDTAGRLHTHHNLMKELEKIKRIIEKTAPDAVLKTILVIDATTGQNGLSQAYSFKDSLDITSLSLTKLDGTAKGGIAFTIQKELNIPVEYVTFGENINDLSKFDPEKFIEALLD